MSLFSCTRQSSVHFSYWKSSVSSAPGGHWWILNPHRSTPVPSHPSRGSGGLAQCSQSSPWKPRQRALFKGKYKAKYSRGNQQWWDKDFSLTEVLRCGSTLPSANYLPLNLLKHMGLGVAFAQETFVDIICSFGLTFFFPIEDWTNVCCIPEVSLPPSFLTPCSSSWVKNHAPWCLLFLLSVFLV